MRAYGTCVPGYRYTNKHGERECSLFPFSLVDTRQREHVNALLRPPGGLLPGGLPLPHGGLLPPHGRPRSPLGVCVALLPLGAELADELRGADGGPVGAGVPRAGAPLQRARGVHADVPLSTHVRAGAVPGSRAVRPSGVVSSSSSRPESRPSPHPIPPPARPPPDRGLFRERPGHAASAGGDVEHRCDAGGPQSGQPSGYRQGRRRSCPRSTWCRASCARSRKT